METYVCTGTHWCIPVKGLGRTGQPVAVGFVAPGARSSVVVTRSSLSTGRVGADLGHLDRQLGAVLLRPSYLIGEVRRVDIRSHEPVAAVVDVEHLGAHGPATRVPLALVG